MLQQQAECFTNILRPLLTQNGVHLLDWEQLTAPSAGGQPLLPRQRFPVLRVGGDPGNPFPFISNLSTRWGCSSSSDRTKPVRAGKVRKSCALGSRCGHCRRCRPLCPPAGQDPYNLDDLFPDMAVR